MVVVRSFGNTLTPTHPAYTFVLPPPAHTFVRLVRTFFCYRRHTPPPHPRYNESESRGEKRARIVISLKRMTCLHHRDRRIEHLS